LSVSVLQFECKMHEQHQFETTFPVAQLSCSRFASAANASSVSEALPPDSLSNVVRRLFSSSSCKRTPSNHGLICCEPDAARQHPWLEPSIAHLQRELRAQMLAAERSTPLTDESQKLDEVNGAFVRGVRLRHCFLAIVQSVLLFAKRRKHLRSTAVQPSQQIQPQKQLDTVARTFSKSSALSLPSSSLSKMSNAFLKWAICTLLSVSTWQSATALWICSILEYKCNAKGVICSDNQTYTGINWNFASKSSGSSAVFLFGATRNSQHKISLQS